MKNILILFILFYSLSSISQNETNAKQHGQRCLSGDTVFIFTGEKLYFKAKKKRKKLKKITHIKPIADTSEVLVFRFNLVGNNSSIASFYNPFNKKLNFKMDILYEGDESFEKASSFYVEPKNASSMAWFGRIKCIKIYSFRFE